MEQKIKIAGVVVLYNPDYAVENNISSYIDKLDVLYVIDNSETINETLVNSIKQINKVIYISLGRNFGIARALNIGLKKALIEGFEWALTMDQDSYAELDMIDKMTEYIINHTISDVGIVSPCHQVENTTAEISREIEEPEEVMTSGNLLNLSIYEKVGGFLDKLFIDYVDIEYCFRLKLNDYRIIRLNNAVLIHKLGEYYKEFKLPFGKKVISTNHNYARKYYITRNEMYVGKLYKEILPPIFRRRYLWLFKQIIIVILVEKNKFKKLMYMAKGFIDYKRGKFGKLNI